MELYWKGKTEGLREKPLPVIICPPFIVCRQYKNDNDSSNPYPDK